jgi:hydrogenase maturation protein HypF
MELEWAIRGVTTDASYPFQIEPKQGILIADWEPLIHALLADLAGGAALGDMAARFHNTLADMIVAIAEQVGIQTIALSGGCFQNRYLTERTVGCLVAAGFSPHWHQRVPPNDGGIALGQILAAARAKE